MKKKIISIVVLLLIGAIYFLYINRPESSSLNAATDTTSQIKRIAAKDFSFQDINNSNYNLSDFKGKVIVVNFRTTSCSACDTEVDFLKRFMPSLDGLNVEFLPVFLDDNKSVIERYLQRRDIKFPIYWDNYGLSALKYGIFALPTSFIIDKDFQVVGKIPGAIDWNNPEIHDLLQRLANE